MRRPHFQFQFGLKTLFVLVPLGLAVLTFVGIGLLLEQLESESKRHQQAREDAWIAAELVKIKSGTTDSLHFYDTRHTGVLLARLNGVRGVKSLEFDLTDISDDDLRLLSTLPDLERLVIYGGSPSVKDDGLAYLSGCGKLAELKLINTQVNGPGLDVLQELPELRYLVLDNDFANGEVHLTVGSLTSLESLTRLKRICLIGPWFSREAAGKLRRALPDCTITTGGNWRLSSDRH